jgi:hypothetical protein
LCKNGHPLVEGNLYHSCGERRCRQCALDYARRLKPK